MFEFLTKNPQLVFFLIVFVIFVIQKVLEVGRAKREAEQERNRPETEIEDFYPDEEPARPSHAPYFPPPLPPAAGGGPPPLVHVARTVPDAAAELARQAELEERLAKIRQAKAQRKPAAALIAAPLLAARQTAPNPAGALVTRLRRPREVRQAMLLKEILDRPVALRR
ncbi:MAG: hypothetical protein MUF04_02575 [Akkermansiaceae bacterium]|jgi:hypothetical protein|nr:hypothetical protein [Akkermansiaceae bacterium]